MYLANMCELKSYKFNPIIFFPFKSVVAISNDSNTTLLCCSARPGLTRKYGYIWHNFYYSNIPEETSFFLTLDLNSAPWGPGQPLQL